MRENAMSAASPNHQARRRGRAHASTSPNRARGYGSWSGRHEGRRPAAAAQTCAVDLDDRDLGLAHESELLPYALLDHSRHLGMVLEELLHVFAPLPEPLAGVREP